MQRESSITIQAARHRFFDDGQTPRGLVPDTILASWQRCLKSGLSVSDRPDVTPIANDHLRDLQQRHDHLRQLCRTELEALHASARSNNGIVVLTAPDGHILDTLGNADFLEKASRVALRPGVAWSEAVIGTNAIGTAMIEKRSIEVRGGEHYFTPHRVLSCAASPILDPQGNVAGVLDLSGEASVQHAHALGMVNMAVAQIEHRWFEQAFGDDEIIQLHRDPSMLGGAGEGLLVFREHRLFAANRQALKLLGIDWGELGRRRYDELFVSALPRPGNQQMLRGVGGDELHARRGRPTTSSPRRQAQSAPAAGRSSTQARPSQPQPVFDTATQMLLNRAVRLVDADIPVLLHGETGCGKEVFARELHRRSRRAHAPFVAINCAALPEGLIEAELFGYAPGAFTGARREGMPGLLREARGGMLFLDEIGDMPLPLQSRLLRVLQEREVTPLGSQDTIALEFSVVAASHRCLSEAVGQGEFRPDLFYRIGQSRVALPPLRAHADIAGLIGELWGALGGDAAGMRLAPAAIARLAAHGWPGNMRQLVGHLRSLIALGEPGELIDADALSPELGPTAAAPPTTLEGLEQHAMEAALQACGGNVAAAARQLGVSRSTLYRRLKIS